MLVSRVGAVNARMSLSFLDSIIRPVNGAIRSTGLQIKSGVTREAVFLQFESGVTREEVFLQFESGVTG